MPDVKNKMMLEVFCLCAQWCGTCRTYQPSFLDLEKKGASVRFFWVDIEAAADQLSTLDIEDFPTILIRASGLILFFGTQLPHIAHLERLIDNFQNEPFENLQKLAFSGERALWQAMLDLKNLPSSSVFP